MSDLDVQSLEHLIDHHHAEDTAPGLAYGIVRDGRLVHSGGRGALRRGGPEPDADTAFRIASMTKSFTAAMVLALRDEGLLRLDDAIAEYLPHVADLRLPTRDAPAPAVRNLLTMTAGLPTDDPWGDRQQDLPDVEFTELLAGGLSFAWAPGTAFEYSNTSYAVLGQLISVLTDQPYPDTITHRLLRPLGMHETGFTAEVAADDRLARGHRRLDAGWEPVTLAGHGAFGAMGGLFSTVTDLARWVSFLAGAFPPRDDGRDDPDGAPLGRATRRELQLPHLGLPPSITWTSLAEPPRIRGAAYGFGLIVEHDPRHGVLVSHSGGYPGFGSHMRWHPGSGLGVVVLANATYAPAPRLAVRLLDGLLETEPRAGSSGRSGGWTDGRPVHHRRPGSFPAPAGGSLVEATAAARATITRLVTHGDEQQWDRAVTDLLAVNLDPDDPLPRRRRMLADALVHLGPLEPDDEPVVADSPAHCVWWLAGPGGRLRCEIRMTPELPSRVQTLALIPAFAPSATLTGVAEAVAAQLGVAEPRWPDDIPLDEELDREQLTRQLRVAAAWAGASTLGPVTAGDGQEATTLRLDGERLTLRLSLAVEGGRVSVCTLVPEP